MCGVFLSCSLDGHKLPDSSMLENLKRRGPDCCQVIQRTIRLGPDAYHQTKRIQEISLVFCSTVLSLRGDTVIAQPLQDDASGSLLCWNGEAWKVDDELVSGNDAKFVFQALIDFTKHLHKDCSSQQDAERASFEAIKAVFRGIAGPFSFIFYDAVSQRLYFGRDSLGRRSLLFTIDSPYTLVISSTSTKFPSKAWREIDADGIYVLDLAHDFSMADTSSRDGFREVEKELPAQLIPWAIIGAFPIVHSDHFSKGLTVTNREQPISLNRDLAILIPVGIDLESKAVKDLHTRLSSSCLVRVRDIPIPSQVSEGTARVAVLFSGGIDCTVLARVIHDIMPLDYAIDLLNVAFENPRVLAAAKKASGLGGDQYDRLSSAYNQCPDRISGIRAHAELLRVCQNRSWRFVAINVPFSETEAHRSRIIELMHPHNTEMDFSIACVLYFAARGHGTVYSGSPLEPPLSYSTEARVLMSGLGADELFGGYARHATAFTKGGYTRLLDELDLDINRLGKRNLGRDDRVISNWGREVRYPYLDEEVVRFALRLPIWEKYAFRPVEHTEAQSTSGLPLSEPGKHILRLLAWKLGMKTAAVEKKRAMQFGARTAKMVAGRVKGTQTVE